MYNLILDTDSYKCSHFLQFPPNTTGLYSYFEARGTDTRYGETVFFGLQYIIKKYLLNPISQIDIDEAERFCAAHGVPFNKEGWQYILKNHKGYLPVRIKAVKEGTVVPLRNVLFTIESTDPQAPWVGSYIESVLVRTWYPITVATISWQVKQMIRRSLEKTSDNPEAELPFKLHDFGARGVSSFESSEIGGASHLVNFMGSDTIAGIMCANRYYSCDMAGFSIPASEHDTMTIWGRDGEIDAYENMLDQFAKPGKMVAIVSDSYNIWEAIKEMFGKKLKQKIIDSGATVIIRPDSGDPQTVVLRCLEELGEAFGYTYNEKDYKVLNHNVRVIQGDGCDPLMTSSIMEIINRHRWSTTNVAFGMGGGLLQKLNRDTFKFALKGAAATVDGKVVEIYKSPIDDPVKKSKKGYQSLIKAVNDFGDTTWGTVNVKDHPHDQLEVVYENGRLLRDQSLAEIRELSDKSRYWL